MRALLRATLARVTRTRRGRVPLLAWSLLAVAMAMIARTAPSGGAGHVLVGPFGQALLPLATYGIASAVSGGGGLRGAQRGVVSLGASPARAALASVLVATLGSALLSAVLATVVSAIAHGPIDPPLATDLPTTFGVGLLGGATYGAFFAAGSAVGRGGARAALLVVDLVLGGGAGFGALFVPRAHLTSLLGGDACYELPRRASSVALLVILAASFVLAVRLGRRAQG